MADEEPYSTIRQHLGKFIGKRVVEITQQDQEEYESDGRAYVMMMFEDGEWIQFFIAEEPAICYSEEVKDGE